MSLARRKAAWLLQARVPWSVARSSLRPASSAPCSCRPSPGLPGSRSVACQASSWHFSLSSKAACQHNTDASSQPCLRLSLFRLDSAAQVVGSFCRGCLEVGFHEKVLATTDGLRGTAGARAPYRVQLWHLLGHWGTRVTLS